MKYRVSALSKWSRQKLLKRKYSDIGKWSLLHNCLPFWSCLRTVFWLWFINNLACNAIRPFVVKQTFPCSDYVFFLCLWCVLVFFFLNNTSTPYTLSSKVYMIPWFLANQSLVRKWMPIWCLFNKCVLGIQWWSHTTKIQIIKLTS